MTKKQIDTTKVLIDFVLALYADYVLLQPDKPLLIKAEPSHQRICWYVDGLLTDDLYVAIKDMCESVDFTYSITAEGSKLCITIYQAVPGAAVKS